MAIMVMTSSVSMAGSKTIMAAVFALQHRRSARGSMEHQQRNMAAKYKSGSVRDDS